MTCIFLKVSVVETVALEEVLVEPEEEKKQGKLQSENKREKRERKKGGVQGMAVSILLHDSWQ